MQVAIILHGMPSKEEYFSKDNGPSRYNKHWIPWLQRQLTSNGFSVQAPELPEPYKPDYKKWCSVFEQFKIDKNTYLIGHSCGGGFLVRWLSENKIKVGKVALVAPWINPSSGRVTAGFFDFKIDDKLSERAKNICLFISSDDDIEELNTADLLKREVRNLQVKEFTNMGHFTFNSMGTEIFPELKEFLLDKKDS